MRFYSTSNKGKTTFLKEAILGGLAPDGGLYLPQIIPQVSRQFLDKLHTLTFPQMALELSQFYFGQEIPPDVLRKIAVGYAFHKTPHVHAIFLYPKNMVSFVQEQQLKKYIKNIIIFLIRTAPWPIWD